MSQDTPTQQQFRIGEFSRRVGVDAEVLRSWERRYSLTDPRRTAGGLRLYGAEEERRVRRMREHLAAGLSAAEAAALTRREFTAAPEASSVTAGPTPVAPAAWAADPTELWEALDRLDEVEANAIFDRLLGAFSLSTVVRDAVLPYLHELGDRWRDKGDAVIAQEHFATAMLRGRLLGLARGWGGGYGPGALLACFPGDFHDLGLICFGLALREHGWRITFLGANTPYATIQSMAAELNPQLTVLTRMATPEREEDADALRSLAHHGSLALAGGGIAPELAASLGAELLREDPFTAAEGLAARYAGASAA